MSNEKREKLERTIAELEEFETFATERQESYQKDREALQYNTKNAVLTVDFFSSQSNQQTKFIDFVIVVCTAEPLTIPESFLNNVIEPSVPVRPTSQQPPKRKEKRKRKTKKQILEQGGGRKKQEPT